jgi:hypothetical protein
MELLEWVISRNRAVSADLINNENEKTGPARFLETLGGKRHRSLCGPHRSDQPFGIDFNRDEPFRQGTHVTQGLFELHVNS